jgi:hypothetical protein
MPELQTYTWGEASSIGAKAAKLAIEYFQAHGFQVADLQEDRFWQRLDVDLSVEDFGLVEVKANTYDDAAIFIETVRNAEAGRPGWAVWTQADYVLFFRAVMGNALLFPVDTFREWVIRRVKDFPHKVTYTHTNALGTAYHSEGHIVPVQILLEEVEGAQYLTGFPRMEKKGTLGEVYQRAMTRRGA